jgi:hypothetical protein
MGSAAPALTPHGRLVLLPAPDAPHLDPNLAESLRAAFDRGSGHPFPISEPTTPELRSLPFLPNWREFGASPRQAKPKSGLANWQ